ncbi:hypothetical protein EYF80_045600 [Liparis tanakae]|uniref:Uncharacterized protein n=1 Tax=Liparis tanakae TaxID=230148 RepID=A0A4Z2FTR3_9TELE|nr:hypothetical protein EYF80_045600 [Liparis tanakae]
MGDVSMTSSTPCGRGGAVHTLHADWKPNRKHTCFSPPRKVASVQRLNNEKSLEAIQRQSRKISSPRGTRPVWNGAVGTATQKQGQP